MVSEQIGLQRRLVQMLPAAAATLGRAGHPLDRPHGRRAGQAVVQVDDARLEQLISLRGDPYLSRARERRNRMEDRGGLIRHASNPGAMQGGGSRP